MAKVKIVIAQIVKGNALTDRYEVIKSPSNSKRHNPTFPKVGTRLSLDEFDNQYIGISLTIRKDIYVDWQTGEQKKF